MSNKYYKYYVCGNHVIKAIRKEIAEKKFKKLGVDVTKMSQTIDYKKAIKIANSNWRN